MCIDITCREGRAADTRGSRGRQPAAAGGAAAGCSRPPSPPREPPPDTQIFFRDRHSFRNGKYFERHGKQERQEQYCKGTEKGTQF